MREEKGKMKPLTIDELKALEVGDWVWLIYLENNDREYAKIMSNGKDMMQFCTAFPLPPYIYSDYGKTWLTYKSKEQAECKGEIIEVPPIMNVENSEEYNATVFILRRHARRLAELRGEKIQE